MRPKTDANGIFKLLRNLLAGCAAILIFSTTASGLIMVGLGNDPVKDNNWPAGSLEVANLKTRVGWWEGPPFGGGQHQFLYRGNAAAFQQALDLFAKIRAPRLQLVVREGPQENIFLRNSRKTEQDLTVDWSFTVWDPVNWNHLYNNPQSTFSSEDPSGNFRQPVDPPRLDVYVAAAGGKGIDWAKISVPKNITVSDERASAAGYAPNASGVIRGDVYDMVTSKPILGARILLDTNAATDWTEAASAKSDDTGHFELKSIAAGNYRLSISADGYVPRLLGYLELGHNALKEYTVHLCAPAHISGNVRDTDGNPVAGARVRADNIVAMDGRGYLIPQRPEVVSDAAGKFELSGVPQGWLQFYVSAESHQMLDALKQYSVPSADIALHVTATGSIKGKVLKPDGNPANDAQVSVNPQGERIGKWGGSTNVNAEGTFTFQNVPPGKYLVSANPGLAISGADPDGKLIEVKARQTAQVELLKK